MKYKNQQKPYLQAVMSAKRILVGEYTTKSGQVKNRYRTVPGTEVVKFVQH